MSIMRLQIILTLLISFQFNIVVSNKIPKLSPLQYYPFTNKLPPTTPLDILVDNLNYLREMSKNKSSNNIS